MSDTPESNKAKIAFTSLFANDDAYWVPFKVSCKLERERDKARSNLEFMRDLFQIQGQRLNDVLRERDRLAAALREIDMARLDDFMGPHDMALKCVLIARESLAAVEGGEP
jgi:hypothetical protein